MEDQEEEEAEAKHPQEGQVDQGLPAAPWRALGADPHPPRMAPCLFKGGCCECTSGTEGIFAALRRRLET